MRPLALPTSLTPTALSEYRRPKEISLSSFVLALLFLHALGAFSPMFMCTFILLELRHDHSIYGFLHSICFLAYLVR